MSPYKPILWAGPPADAAVDSLPVMIAASTLRHKGTAPQDPV